MNHQDDYTTRKHYSSRIAPVDHGLNHTRLYSIWNSMKTRCSNPNNISYKYYGAKGIAVCETWSSSFMNFYNWAIENGYRDDLTIDRIDCRKGYSPENCRWATVKEQRRNRAGYNHLLTYDGRTQCVAAWAEELGINSSTLYTSLRKGMQDHIAIEHCISMMKRGL